MGFGPRKKRKAWNPVAGRSPEKNPEPGPEPAGCCGAAPPPPGLIQRIGDGIRFSFTDLLYEIGPLLLFGLALAGGISWLIPDGFFERHLGSGFMSMLVMLVAGHAALCVRHGIDADRRRADRQGAFAGRGAGVSLGWTGDERRHDRRCGQTAREAVGGHLCRLDRDLFPAPRSGVECHLWDRANPRADDAHARTHRASALDPRDCAGVAGGRDRAGVAGDAARGVSGGCAGAGTVIQPFFYSVFQKYCLFACSNRP